MNGHHVAGEAHSNDGFFLLKMCSDSWNWRLRNCQLLCWERQKKQFDMRMDDLFRFYCASSNQFDRFVTALLPFDQTENHIFAENCIYSSTSVVRALKYLFVLFSIFKYWPPLNGFDSLLFACLYRVHCTKYTVYCTLTRRWVRKFQLSQRSLLNNTVGDTLRQRPNK